MIATALLAFGFLLVANLAVGGDTDVVALPLWDGVPPGSEAFDGEEKYEARDGVDGEPNGWLTGVSRPVVSVYRPAADRATGAAVVVFPGGGYRGQAIDKEGHFVARWLRERGVVAAVVPYRCGGGEHRHPVPLSDAQRAVRLVRSHAHEWGVDPAKVGVMGFSAGGHLAATASTLWTDADPEADDPLERLGSRPDFAVLVYPVISMRPEVTHGGSRQNLLMGDKENEELVTRLSADEQVTPETPPTLIVHALDDGGVPVENARRYFDACRAHGVPVEMHLYETGGHGFGLWASGGSVAAWPAVLEGWLAGRGLAR